MTYISSERLIAIMQMIHSIPHGACLVERMVNDLATKSPMELQQTLVLLPTRRLQLQVAAYLAARHDGASWLPQMETWDQFLRRESFAFLDHNMVMVSSAAELILSDLLKDQRLRERGISEGHAHELLHFLQELWRHNKRCIGTTALTEWLERQWHITPEAICEIEARTASIYGVLENFEAVLHKEGYALQEEIDSHALQRWIAEMEANRWAPTTTATRIVIAGLTSLPDGQLALLKQLVHWGRVELWLDTPWLELPQDAPLRKIRTAIDPKDREESIALSNVKFLLANSDPFCEAAAALARAQQAIDSGVPAHRVGILVPDESQYATALATLSEQMGVVRNIPLSRPWASTQAGSWYEMLQKWVSGRDAVTFASLLLNPLSQSIVFESQNATLQSEDIQNFPYYVSQWLRDAPRQLDSKIIFDLSVSRARLPAPLIEIFNHGWRIFQGSPEFSMEGQSQFWHSCFVPAIERLLEGNLEPLERAAWQSLISAAESINLLPKALLAHTRSWSGFINALAKMAQDTSPRETGEPLAHLQIISITEARYVPLDVAIIVGCIEGIFPHKVPRDSLVDNTLKTALDLPGWRQLEALEDSTFGLLISRIPRVELLWSENMGGSPSVRSRWVEKLHATGLEIERFDSQFLRNLFGESATLTLSAGARTLDLEGYVSDRETLLTKVSASSLKALMTCPYQFLLRQRGVTTFTPREEEDPILVGSLLHRVIELCIRPDASIEKRLPPGNEWRRDFCNALDVEHWAVKRLRSISQIIIPKSLQSSPEILQITQRSWAQLAKDWGMLFELGWNPALARVEEKFGTKEQPVFLKLDERTIAVTGAIDVIHYNPTTRSWIVCDYKTGNPPPTTGIRQGLEPQLVLYTMCLQAMDDEFKPERGVISYRSLKTGEFHTVSIGQDLVTTWAGPFGNCKLDLAELVTAFTAQWLQRIKQVESQERFYAESSHCGYCDFADVCRKDDPSYRDRIRLQESLS